MKNELLLSNSIFYNSPLQGPEKEYEPEKQEKKGINMVFLIFSGILVVAFVLSKLYSL
jgi:hypothetical protein